LSKNTATCRRYCLDSECKSVKQENKSVKDMLYKVLWNGNITYDNFPDIP